MRFVNKRLVRFCKRILKINPTLKRLLEVVQKLDEVSASVDTFFQLVKEAKQEQKEQQLQLYRERETGSFPKNVQIGRWKEKNFVIEWLRNPSNEYECQTDQNRYSKISVLSIVGHGGMGKTTLLQHVYKEMTDEFDLKIWVCVSIDFDVKKVIADMLESLKKDRPRLDTLDALQVSLEREVNSKKLLLVLDDIWEEDSERSKSKWSDVFSPLASAKVGSKILVTTRMESVALIIADLINKKKETLILEGLKEDELLQLLNRYAFANAEDPYVYQKLTPIAAKIVKKLLGFPLAAKVIGSVLNDRLDERHWISVLESDNIARHNDILSILKLSYLFLPNALQNCYAFCAVFPQDYLFNADDLTRMWISLGFIQPFSIGGETSEDNGRSYFNTLFKKSLFDEFQGEEITYYKLHDLLHELVRSVSAKECFTITNNDKIAHFTAIPDTIRHLFVQGENLQLLRRNIRQLKQLRSIFWESYSVDWDVLGLLAKIFKISTRIRVLGIISCPSILKMMPKELGHLIHLRYFSVYDRRPPLTDYDIYLTGIKIYIFNLLIDLYHLQFIEIQGYFFGNHTDLLRADINDLVRKFVASRYKRLLENIEFTEAEMF